MAPLELAEQIEKAEGLEDHFLDLFTGNALTKSWDLIIPVSMCWDFDEGQEHERKRGRFFQLVNIGAFLDAAMMLVPEGWWIQHLGYRLDGWIVRIETNGPPSISLPLGLKFIACATPALALCAAALRAHASRETQPAQGEQS